MTKPHGQRPGADTASGSTDAADAGAKRVDGADRANGAGRGAGAAGDERLEITEPAGLRAISHPARLAALQRLMMIGPATATELGETAGLSASAMSYHLRSLEKAGLIETAPSRGDGRERVWRSVHSGYTVDHLEGDSIEMREASRELIETVLIVQELRVRRWLAMSETEKGWIDSGYFFETLLNVTQAELAELNEKIQELVKPYRLSLRGSPPAEARQTSFVARGFPLADPVPADAARLDGESPRAEPG
jgi:DNA-binding transcriptional ArsR family regulator